MQLLLDLDDRTGRLVEIHRRLRQTFGPPGPFLRLDPVSQLILSLIGGRTRSGISKSAFEALRMRFNCWKSLRDAPADEIEDIIRSVTFAEVKAPRLKAALAAITKGQGGLTLDSLAELSVTDALAWLERLPGVGRKVAAAALNFSTLRMRALVIDTHHLRVLQRLMLVDTRASLAHAYDRIVPLLPPDWSAADLDDHHQLMKRLGQTHCRHSRPLCHRCPLQESCPTASARRDGPLF